MKQDKLRNYPNYPFVIHRIAEKVERLSFKQTHSWSELQTLDLPPLYLDDMLFRRAAERLAHKFADKIYDHKSISQTDEPEGRTLTISTVALRYDELLELLYTAYAEGQSDGMHRFSNVRE